jgi:hypothetical protein
MCKKTSKKIFSVTREKDDIIFLSDVRLNSDKQISATNDIKKGLHFRVMTSSPIQEQTQGVFVS